MTLWSVAIPFNFLHTSHTDPWTQINRPYNWHLLFFLYIVKTLFSLSSSVKSSYAVINFAGEQWVHASCSDHWLPVNCTNKPQYQNNSHLCHWTKCPFTRHIWVTCPKSPGWSLIMHGKCEVATLAGYNHRVLEVEIRLTTPVTGRDQVDGHVIEMKLRFSLRGCLPDSGQSFRFVKLNLNSKTQTINLIC